MSLRSDLKQLRESEADKANPPSDKLRYSKPRIGGDFWKLILAIGALASFGIGGLLINQTGSTILIQIFGVVCFLVGSVLLVGAVVVERLQKIELAIHEAAEFFGNAR